MAALDLPITEGLVLRLEAEDWTRMGAFVQHWHDSSGQGNDATAGYPPIAIDGATPSGLGAARFSGQQYLDIAGRPEDFDGKSRTWYVVFRPDEFDNGRVINTGYSDITGDALNPVSNYAAWGSMPASNGRYRVHGRSANGDFFAAQVQNVVGSQEFIIGGGIWNSVTGKLFVATVGAGGIRTTGSLTGAVAQPSGHLGTRIGAGSGVSSSNMNVPIRGDIAAVLVYDRQLSEAEQASVEDHLRSTYLQGPVSPPAEDDLLALPVAAPGGHGPLALRNLRHVPMGYGHVFGSAQPDLFVSGFGGLQRLYLFPWRETDPDGTPVFKEAIQVQSPFTERGQIFQTDDGVIHGIWLTGREVVHTTFNADSMAFSEVGRVLVASLPSNPVSVAVFPMEDGSVDLVFEISDGVQLRDGDPWTEEWRPYDGAGIWTGNLPYRYLYVATFPALLEGPVEAVRQVSPTQREVFFGIYQLAAVNLGPGREKDLITGSRLGAFVHYSNEGSQQVELGQRRPIAGLDGNGLRHPTSSAGVMAYPNPESGLSNLIGGGEGALYFYRFAESFTSGGAPVFEQPVAVIQESAELFGGSLPVVSVVDWNGDGLLDIVAGNSEGRVLFLENVGSNEEPSFLPGVPIHAGGEEIFIQAGYKGSIQGIQEARWGYACPTVVDWNGNGLLDIVMGDITGSYTVYINRGTPGEPLLDPERPIYWDGLDLHGMWRVQPAVARVGERTAMVIVDGEDHFHLFWAIDDYNVKSGGKLRLSDGSLISASHEPGGGTGRCKLTFFDWTGNGKLDLVIGTSRRNAIPNKETGYPQPTLGTRPLATVLLMENSGTNEAPVFEHAVPFVHQVWGIVQPGGAHACTAAGTSLGGGPGPNLLVGNETGRFFILRGEHLSY